MVAASPTAPTVGLKLLIVGALLVAVTVKDALLVAEPDGDVTAIGPVAAPPGTVATIWVAADELTVAAVPLNVTVFSLGVALKPVPRIVTVVPDSPLDGENVMIDTVVEAWRAMAVRLPVAS
jgi:hypothetical protein